MAEEKASPPEPLVWIDGDEPASVDWPGDLNLTALQRLLHGHQ